MKNQLLFQTYSHPLISEAEIEQIIVSHKKVKYKKGDFILKKNQTANSYLILESGLVRSFVYDYNNNDITTDFFCQNEVVIDVISIFQRIPSQENIQALTDCEAWEIDFETFQDLFHSIKGFSEWGRLWMASKLLYFKQRSLNMVTISSKERYLKLVKEKPQIILHSPLKHVASYLGITDTSLSRIRKETL